jgi:acyl transferase domain-containing protein
LSFEREEIAIVGMAGRFPGARNLDEFWQNLRDGVVSIKPFSEDQLKASGVEEAALDNPTFVNSGAVIEGADLFDADFFGYTPLEAQIMDPQHRVLLESAWEALENAGYNPDTCAVPVGVFGAVSTNTYHHRILVNRSDMLTKAGYQLVGLLNEKDHAATRISFKLNLKGPSVSVQTACSASLVAFHMACQSVLSGECDMALAGGARIDAPLHRGYFCEEGDILSPDGQCRVFDAQAQGTVFGNGVAMVVVKRLSDALRDRDTIHALIKGTAINNDGSLKAGYSAPSIQGQAKVIEEALLMAEVIPDTIGYVEAHGTGTSLGDPIEIAALAKAYRKWTEKRGYCAIGSVKANIGHLFAAAGVAGVIKAVLAIKNRQIPPAANFRNPNPKIDFERSPFFVADRLSEWCQNRHPRRAAVSSFGMGGTNAHIILQEAPNTEAADPSRRHHLVTVSARSGAALEQATSNLVEFLNKRPDSDLANVSYTLQIGRKSFGHRHMLVCENVQEAVRRLERRSTESVATPFMNAEKADVVFMFSGQGSQYPNMGLELYRTESEFQKHVDRCSEILRPQLGLDLRDILYPGEKNTEETARQLRDTLITQPALFTIEYALARLWISWGIRPMAFVGHSIGEYVGACLADVFSLKDGLSLVATRGRLMSGCRRGSMMAVHLSEEAIQLYLKGGVSLGAVNAPSLCVVSGETEAIEELEKVLSEKQIDCRHLHTSHAFHSQMMDPIEDAFAREASKVDFHPPQIPIVSTVTGTWITPEEIMRSEYWVKNFRQTVRFSDCIRELLKEPDRIFLEVGPGQALSTFARQHADGSKGSVVLSTTRHPQENKSDVAFILNTLGRLWLAGVEVNWLGFHGDRKLSRIPLPAYPFERKRYWVEPQENHHEITKPQGRLSGKAEMDKWFYTPSWKRLPIPSACGKRGGSFQRLNWLVFLDEFGFGERLAERLRRDTHTVITLKTGAQYNRLGEEIICLNPLNPADYQRVLQELRLASTAPDRIVHLWSLSNANHCSSQLSWQDLGFYSLLFLAQAIEDEIPDKQIQIKIISDHLQSVTGDEELIPEKATLLGPCRVIPQEYPSIQCKSVDIVFPEKRADRDYLESLVMDEIYDNGSECVVAYRGRNRWVESFEPVQLEKVADRHQRLRDRGVYLITGGLGGIGLALAEFLGKKARARLVLLSRTMMPPREQWNQWLRNRGEKDAISRKILKVIAIEKLGAEVILLSSDVTDMVRMREAIAHIHDHFGTLHGVVHAAGVPGAGSIQMQKPESVKEVLSPKVKATYVLWELLGGIDLDFFVLCSSIASVIGGIGQAHYCAANAFLDAFANSNVRKNVISVNWCAWQEVGMAVNTEVPDSYMARRSKMLESGISVEEGKEVFSRILESSYQQVLVSRRRLPYSLDLHQEVASADVDGNAGKISSSKTGYARPDLPSDLVLPRNTAEQAIAAIWEELLCIEKVGINDNFFDLGGHSLLVGRLTNRLKSAFPQAAFARRTIFERPTVRLLSQLIMGDQKPKATLSASKSRGLRRRQRASKNSR